jgi:signal peptidase I
MKNILWVTVFVVVIVVSIFAVPLMLKYFLGVDQPVMTVISGSMWPSFSRGDIVFVMKTDIEDIKVGTVVVFEHEKGLAVHRVVAMDEWWLTTQGDANAVADSPILYSSVVGRVPQIGGWEMKIPWLGHISLLANPSAGASEPGETADVNFWDQLRRIVLSPVGFIVFIIFPLLIIFQNPILAAVGGIIPMPARKRRLQKRAKRLQASWGEARVKRAFRL